MDSDYVFEDFGNLVRKARQDYGAEITLVGTGSGGDERPFATPSQFHATTDSADPAFGGPLHRGHALIATIAYGPPPNDWPDCPMEGNLVVLKPSVDGDEPFDVLQYRETSPLFPQEPTSQQFFDEEQWESYRRLGEHICEQVVGKDLTRLAQRLRRSGLEEAML